MKRQRGQVRPQILRVKLFDRVADLAVKVRPDIGVKRSSAQITNYTSAELMNRLVLAVVNFPPRQIGPFSSEVLTLGTYRDERVLLVSPEQDAQPGDRLG